MHDAFRLTAGLPDPMGVTLTGGGVNVAVFSAHATRIELCLFDDADRETARITLPERTGDILHGHVAGIGAGQRYGLRAHGPHAPREGHRFNAHKLLLDPQAALIDRPFVLHPSMFGYRLEGADSDPEADLGFDDTDSAPFMPKAVVLAPALALQPRPLAPWSRTVIYEMHVKGFTRLHPKVPAAQRGTFAGLAHPAPIRHLAELGISTVELMPVAAWLDERHLPPLGLSNYWGYNPVGFGAPDPRLSPGGWNEIAAAVEKLEAAGIETILDVVLNHTGEGDHLGPTVSLKGLDNASYYRLDPSDPRRYANDAGCGNTLALERPAILRLATDSLRRFAERAGVHGFRFDLAATLGRRAGGFDPRHPLLVAIAQDPVLSPLKLIAEPWDIGMGGYQLGAFPAGWGEWNDRYRDTARRFWRGDSGMAGEMATRMAGSADVFAPRRRPVSRSVNYIAAHDGFTLSDLVSHERKHNEANGEDNRDGTDSSHSWNHGIEGMTDDPAASEARARDQRALLATLLLSRGTPMLSMGDEMGRTQRGNNNAYAQDNPISWLDWSAPDTALIDHVRSLIATRLATPALHDDRALSGAPCDECGLPDVEWLRADGTAMRHEDWHDPHNRLVIASLYTRTPADSRAIVVLNAGCDPVTVTLPEPRPGQAWARPGAGQKHDSPPEHDSLAIGAREAICLVEIAARTARPRSGVDQAVLAQLADAAGIAPDWWEVSGRRHEVSPEVKAALLAAMRLPAHSTAEARMSLMRLRRERDRRGLPSVLVATEGEPIALDLPQAPGRRLWLALEGEDRSIERFMVPPDAGTALPLAGTGAGTLPRRRVALPPLPRGRHHLMLEDHAHEPCHLIVTPARCHEPEALFRRPYGIAAHLYALRRDQDQGIGDFTTLAELGRRAAGEGAVTLGLNPLHALFAHDRDRASPYHPSDRRFLDPIYIDPASGPFGKLPAVRNLMARNESTFRALRTADKVDYPAVWNARREVLSAAFSAMQHAVGHGFASQQEAFAAFIAAGGDALQRFAAFEVIAAHHRGKPWTHWPQELRDAQPAAIDAFCDRRRAELRFVMFQQWLAEAGLADAAAATGLSLGLYRDLAVGAAPDGAEAWACQALFATGVSIGAPPDPFSSDGQVWCLPAPDPHAIRADGYSAFSHLLAANMRHAGALRVDHAMGLQRLFWVPDGASARDGAYVAYRPDEQFQILALESQRAGCAVIGEDLGTVPEGFRDRMASTGVMSCRVLWLERDGPAFRSPGQYPAGAAACVGTHDLPTLAGWWEASDIDEVVRLGTLSAPEAAEARAGREAEKRALAEAMARDKLALDAAGPFDASVAAAVHGWLAASPSELMLVQADDLAGERERLNLPGTDRERPNWRRKLSAGVETLLGLAEAQAILAAVSARRGEAWTAPEAFVADVSKDS